jgi:hypothetical protein
MLDDKSSILRAGSCRIKLAGKGAAFKIRPKLTRRGRLLADLSSVLRAGICRIKLAETGRDKRIEYPKLEISPVEMYKIQVLI